MAPRSWISPVAAVCSLRSIACAIVLTSHRQMAGGMKMRRTMTRAALFVAGSWLATAAFAPQAAPQDRSQAAQLTVIRAGTLIDGLSSAPKTNQLIFVRGNKIEKVA